MVVITSSTTYDSFVEEACGALCIDPNGKSFQYVCKEDKSKLIQLKDERGIRLMYRWIHDMVDVFISDSPNAIPRVVSTRESNALRCDANPTPIVGLRQQSDGCVHASTSQDTCNNMHPSPYISEAGYLSLPAVIGGLHIEEGQLFDSPHHFKQTVLSYALLHKFAFQYRNNSRDYYRLVCMVPGCKWKLTAGCDGNSDVVRVKRFKDVHDHTTNDIVSYKPVIRAKYTRGMIKHKIVSKPSYSVGQICTDFSHSHTIEMTYHQAWSAKEWAKMSITGDPRDSFKFVPWMCNRLLHDIPGTWASYTMSPDARFKQLFVAYGPSISGFHCGCRPLLFIDAYHLKAHYGGSLMAATALDANNGLYPLAYSFSSGENDENWLWFLEELKVILAGRNVVIMSDRNASLLSGIIKTFGGHCSAHCLRHLKENFSSFCSSNGLKNKKRETALKILNDIAYARDETMFQHHLAVMHNFNPDLAKWVTDNKPEHWANLMFSMKRWDWMNTNPGESFNAQIGELRELTIFQFMKEHVLKFLNTLVGKKVDCDKCTLPVLDRIEEKILLNLKETHGFGHCNNSPGTNTVIDREFKRYAVRLNSHQCSCLAWQMSGIPCTHAMSVVGHSGLTVYDLVDKYYRKETQESILKHMMPPVHTHDETTVEQLSTNAVYAGLDPDSFAPILPLPPVMKRRPGRPRKKRIESQFQDKRIVHCSRYHQPGHNRTNCREPIPEFD